MGWEGGGVGSLEYGWWVDFLGLGYLLWRGIGGYVLRSLRVGACVA